MTTGLSACQPTSLSVSNPSPSSASQSPLPVSPFAEDNGSRDMERDVPIGAARVTLNGSAAP